MKRLSPAVLLGLSAVAWASAAGPARAIMIAPSPLAQRVVTADVVVVGTVTSLEPKTIRAARFPGDREKGEYRVAVVKVEEGLVGARGLTHVRVGFQLPPPPPPPPQV